MTWRERIAAAREAGGFTSCDRIDIASFDDCMVGEAARAAGIEDVVFVPACSLHHAAPALLAELDALRELLVSVVPEDYEPVDPDMANLLLDARTAVDAALRREDAR